MAINRASISPIVEVWINQHRDRYVTATASTA